MLERTTFNNVLTFESSFGNGLSFKMDDIDVSKIDDDLFEVESIDRQVVDFITNNTEQLEQTDQAARDYWAPLGEALRFEREYANSDENWLFPNDDSLNTPLSGDLIYFNYLSF